MTKNKCYDCVHRREVPGSAHSACEHPANFDEGPQRAADALRIRANYHGINGWFEWPVNFDPVWLDNCDGFTPRESATSVDAVDPSATSTGTPTTREKASS